MRTFDVYTHPALSTQAVKRGFSWPGLFLIGIWALFKRLWLIGSLSIIAYVILCIIESLMDASGRHDLGLIYFCTFILRGSIHVLLGINGNTLVRRELSRKGYDLVSTVVAETPEAAIAAIAKSSTA